MLRRPQSSEREGIRRQRQWIEVVVVMVVLLAGEGRGLCEGEERGRKEGRKEGRRRREERGGEGREVERR